MSSSTVFSITHNGTPLKYRSNRSPNPYIITFLNQSIASNIYIRSGSIINMIYKKKIKISPVVYKNLVSNYTSNTSLDIINSVEAHEGKLVLPKPPAAYTTAISPVHMYTICNQLLHHNTGFVIVKNEDLDIDIYDPPNKNVLFFNGTLDEIF